MNAHTDDLSHRDSREDDQWRDELRRRLEAADPARTPLDAGSSERAQMLLREILATPKHSHAPRPRLVRFALPLGAAVAATVALIFAFSVVTPPGVAPAAALPLPLELSAPPGSTAEVLAQIDETLASPGGPTEALRQSVSTGWYLKIDGATLTIDPGPIVPQVVRTQWNEDLSGSIIISTGEPYYPGHPGTPAADGEGPAPGTVLHEIVFDPGQFDTFGPATFGDSEEEMLVVLRAFGMEDDADAARAMNVVAFVLDHWTLSNAQHRTLLKILDTREGFEVAGTTRDRAGRDALVFRALTPDGNFEQLLLVSRSTGRIVGLETTRIRAIGNIPAGTLMSYQLWETDK